MDRFIYYIRGVWLVFLLLSCFVERSELNKNNKDPEQMPHSAASDLGLLCQCPIYGMLDTPVNGLSGQISSIVQKGLSEYAVSESSHQAVHPCILL